MPTPHKLSQGNTPKDAVALTNALKIGQALIKEGKTKVEATRAMYPLIKDESREIICQAFIDGSGLTERGAMTYFYNVIRFFKKSAPST